jgi:hypothetical protein
MWLPFLNWFVLMMADQSLLQAKSDVVAGRVEAECTSRGGQPTLARIGRSVRP